MREAQADGSFGEWRRVIRLPSTQSNFALSLPFGRTSQYRLVDSLGRALPPYEVDIPPIATQGPGNYGVYVQACLCLSSSFIT